MEEFRKSPDENTSQIPYLMKAGETEKNIIKSFQL